MKSTTKTGDPRNDVNTPTSEGAATREASADGHLVPHLDRALKAVNVGFYEDSIELWAVYGES